MNKTTRHISDTLLMQMLRNERHQLAYWFHKGKSLAELKGIVFTIQLLECTLIVQQVSGNALTDSHVY